MGYKAAAQSDHNPQNTLYDAKRFIGKKFTKSELESEAARYPFQVRFSDSVRGGGSTQRNDIQHYKGGWKTFLQIIFPKTPRISTV